MVENIDLGRVLVFGANGMVGSAIVRHLESMPGLTEILASTRENVDLHNRQETFDYIAKLRPDWVVLAAAKVGGIMANQKYPQKFLSDNLLLELNVIDGAYEAGVKKLMFLGSSCIYPKGIEGPIPETALLNGHLEKTNEAYSIAKIAGIKLCESYNQQFGVDFRSVMPCNLYGPGDNYNAENSHVIPGLMGRLHCAKEHNLDYVKVWGTGLVKREFMHVDDLAGAVIYFMKLSGEIFHSQVDYKVSHLNVGTGVEVKIHELAEKIKEVVGFEGKLIFDDSISDGVAGKLLDSTRAKALGWFPRIDLIDGLERTYESFLKERSSNKLRDR